MAMTRTLAQLETELNQLKLASHELRWFNDNSTAYLKENPYDGWDVNLLHRGSNNDILAMDVDIDILRYIPEHVTMVRLLRPSEQVLYDDPRIVTGWEPFHVSMCINGSHDEEGMRSGAEIDWWCLTSNPSLHHAGPVTPMKAILDVRYPIYFLVSRISEHHFIVAIDPTHDVDIPHQGRPNLDEMYQMCDDMIIKEYPSYEGCDDTRIHLSMPYSVAREYGWCDGIGDPSTVVGHTATYLRRKGF